MVFVSLTKSCAHKNRYWWMWRKINWTFVRFHVKTVHREYFRSIEIYVANIILIFVSKNLFFYFKQNVAINSHLQTRVWPFQGVNFINVLRAHFCTKFWHQKLQSCVLGLKFFGTKISYKKQARKTLMKLTSDLRAICFVESKLISKTFLLQTDLVPMLILFLTCSKMFFHQKIDTWVQLIYRMLLFRKHAKHIREMGTKK